MESEQQHSLYPNLLKLTGFENMTADTHSRLESFCMIFISFFSFRVCKEIRDLQLKLLPVIPHKALN
jgi:hypothetical protein